MSDTPTPDGDIFGRDAFFAWFNPIWPEPSKESGKFPNWQHRKNVAYGAWFACERHESARVVNAELERPSWSTLTTTR